MHNMNKSKNKKERGIQTFSPKKTNGWNYSILTGDSN